MNLFKNPLTAIHMLNNKTIAYLILILTPLFSAYRVPLVYENNAAADFISSLSANAEKFRIDTKESVVTWKCAMQLTPQSPHIGYVYISKGELIIEKDQLTGGTVEIDMNTIADKDHGSENSLVEHLKSPDFFEVQKFPTASFVITKVLQGTGQTIYVTGNLTIKGITNAVTFPATLDIKNGIATANGEVIIDRTQWNIRYKSGKFFFNLADEAISDSIALQMKIVAKK
jgi:polyisoprenoid-binding protein YceI